MPYIPNRYRNPYFQNLKYTYSTSMRVAIKQMDTLTAPVSVPRMWKVWLYNGYHDSHTPATKAPHFLALASEFEPIICTDDEFAALVFILQPVVIKRDTAYRQHALPASISHLYELIPYWTDYLGVGYAEWVRVDLLPESR